MHDAAAGGGVDTAGVGGADVGARVAEVGVVPRVKHFPAEMEVHMLAGWKPLKRAK